MSLTSVPADVEVTGDIEDGHAPGQLQDVSLEGLGVAASGIGEGDLDLAHQATFQAFDAWDGQDHGGHPAADRQGAESAPDVTARRDLTAAADRTSAIVVVLLDSEDHLAADVVGADVVIAADAEGVIQQAGGHADLPV